MLLAETLPCPDRELLGIITTTGTAQGPSDGVPVPKGSGTASPSLTSRLLACHDSRPGTQGSHSSVPSVRWSPVGMNSAGCYKKEPAKAASSFPDVWGHVGGTPVASGPRGTVWAPGPTANLPWNSTSSHHGRWLLRTHSSFSSLTYPPPDVCGI